MYKSGKDTIRSRMRELENKMDRLLKWEIKKKDGSPLQYPQHFLGCWKAEWDMLDTQLFQTTL